MGLEGLVCKLRDNPYGSGRSQTWVKVHCVQECTFIIVDLVSDGGAVAALQLARRAGKLWSMSARSAPASAARSRASCTRFSPRSPSRSRRSRRPCAIDVGATSASSRDRLSCDADYFVFVGEGDDDKRRLLPSCWRAH